MKQYMYLLGFTLLACQQTDPAPSEEISGSPKTKLLDDAQFTAQEAEKAEAFRKALNPNREWHPSVYIYNRLTVQSYLNAPKRLAARVVLMGYREVLLAVHPENGKNFSELRNKRWIQDFNRYLHEHNVKVYALMFSEASQYQYDAEIFTHASIIQQYNSSVDEKERFAGASADWEPHTLKNPDLAHKAGLAPEDRWHTDRYGKGKANDRLMRRTIMMLAYAKASLDQISEARHLPFLWLNQAMNYHMQERFDQGDLEWGDMHLFLDEGKCTTLNIMCYNHRKEEIWRRAESCLVATSKQGKKNQMLIAIKTRLGDDEGASTSLKPKGWDYLIETLRYLNLQGEKYPSYRGICIYDYSDMESMLLE